MTGRTQPSPQKNDYNPSGMLYSLPPRQSPERLELLQTDSTSYIRRMSGTDTDLLLKGLSKTEGLSPDDIAEMREGRYNVHERFIPDKFRDRH